MTGTRTFLIIMSAFTASTRALCFGDVGHLSVCKLAYDLVSPKTRSALDGIVGSKNAFAEQCVWPDMVKKMKPWNYTGNYHYINYEDGGFWKPTDIVKRKDGSLVATPDNGDMLQMSTRAVEKLATGQGVSGQQKLCYLRFLGHLAGDMHQPLHTGRASDFGGNAVKVTFEGIALYPIRSLAITINRDAAGNIQDDECSKNLFKPSPACVTSKTLMVVKKDAAGNVIKDAQGASVMTFIDNNLHTLWDDGIIDHRVKELGISKGPDFDKRNIKDVSMAFAAALSQDARARESDLKAAMNDDILRWVESSNKFRGLAYDTTGIADNEGYYKARVGIISDLLTRAGYRLAGMLNGIFDPGKNDGSQSVKGFHDARLSEIKARIKARRTTEFTTECDKL